jgi:hypothetical protein
MVQHTALRAYSNCQAAIRRFRHASSPLGSSINQLQNGPLLNGIRQLMLRNTRSYKMHWKKSHPERFKPRMDWTADDKGIYMAVSHNSSIHITNGSNMSEYFIKESWDGIQASIFLSSMNIYTFHIHVTVHSLYITWKPYFTLSQFINTYHSSTYTTANRPSPSKYQCNSQASTASVHWPSNSDTFLSLEHSILSRTSRPEKAATLPRTIRLGTKTYPTQTGSPRIQSGPLLCNDTLSPTICPNIKVTS